MMSINAIVSRPPDASQAAPQPAANARVPHRLSEPQRFPRMSKIETYVKTRPEKAPAQPN